MNSIPVAGKKGLQGRKYRRTRGKQSPTCSGWHFHSEPPSRSPLRDTSSAASARSADRWLGRERRQPPRMSRRVRLVRFCDGAEGRERERGPGLVQVVLRCAVLPCVRVCVASGPSTPECSENPAESPALAGLEVGKRTERRGRGIAGGKGRGKQKER